MPTPFIVIVVLKILTVDCIEVQHSQTADKVCRYPLYTVSYIDRG